MSKMIDLGKKADTSLPTHEGDSAQVLNYPEFHVENDQLAVDGDHVGKHVKATVHLHVKGHEIRTGSDGKETKHTHFAVKGMHIHPAGNDDEGPDANFGENPNKKQHNRLETIKKEYAKTEE